MAPEDRYLTLLTSLPAHGPLFGARHTPISWLRLESRLRWLEAEDAEDLERLSSLVSWHDQRFEVEDEDLVSAAEASIPAFHNDFVREFTIWRLELRTVVAALRRRHAGEAAPAAGRKWGFGRWVPMITRNWSNAHFALGRVYPWLPTAKQKLDEGDPLGLERLLLGAVWSHLDRIAAGHSFDFEAVAVYVLRWDLIARLTRYDAGMALERFDTLLAHALSDVAVDPLMAAPARSA